MAKITKTPVKKAVKAPKVLSVEQFNALPKAEQRVLVAKDVIKQIKARKYRAETSVYVSDMQIPEGIEPTADARTNLNKVGTCSVCALGACLISTTRFKNQLTLKELKDPMQMQNKKKNKELIGSIFEPNQLAAIETVFEQSYSSYGFWSTGYVNEGDMGGYVEKDDRDKLIEWGMKYGNDGDRLVAIMKNIIKNQGEFKP